MNLDDLKKHINIAEKLSEKELVEIGASVVSGFRIDKDSRAEWAQVMEESLKITKQIFEPKRAGILSKAANVKFPLLTNACIDFAARTYPEIVGSKSVVFANVIGKDPQHNKARRALKVMGYMNYQLREGLPDWEPGVDRLLHMLPVFGTIFKKIYYDVVDKKACVEVIEPSCIVVNKNIKCLSDARRITHVLHLYKSDIVERQRAGIYLDFNVDELSHNPSQEFTSHQLQVDQDRNSSNDLFDDDAPIEILEQHRYLDLDKDGYPEPYVVTVAAATAQVLRIYNRFELCHV